MKQKLLTTMMLALMLVWGGQNLWGQTTVSYDFSDGGAVTGLNESSPGIALDANIGFGSFKNSGTSNPAIYSGQLRLYQNDTKGGSIKIYATNGVTITSVVVHSSGTTGPAAYSVDGVGSTAISISGGAYTISSLSATSEVEFWCTGSSSGTRVYVDDFEVIYTSGGGTPTAATPTFTPAAGTFYTAQNVTISTTTPAATIHYTTDGSDPDNTDTEYTTPVAVSSTTTLKAIAYATGFDPSTIGSAVYTFPTIVEVADIATLRGSSTGSTVYKLTGEAILTFQQTFRNQKFIQDGTAGILIDDPSGTLTSTYNIGDGITGILGTISDYYGMLQFVPVADPGAATSTGNEIVPIVITANEFLTNFDNYESRVVEIQNLTFADGGSTFANGQVYVLAEAGITNFNFRTTFYDVDYIGTTIRSNAVNVVGIPNERNNGDYFLTSRDAADISSTPVIPLGTSGIVIAIFLIATVLFYRRGKLF
jgi:hypothetical protein